MPYVNKPRPYKKEYQQQLARGEKDERKVRERARDLIDRNGKDANGNGKADVREGKDIDHKRPITKGGGNSKKNLRITSASANRSFSRNSNHTIKRND